MPLAGVVIRELCRRKDFYVLFVLTALIALLMGGAGLIKGGQFAKYLQEVCLLLIWISSLIIAITTAARQIPQERESRTLFPLLAKPVSRGQVVVGKFLGCWLATGFCLAVFYALFAGLALARGQHLPVANFFSVFALHWAMLGMVIAMTLLGSLLTNAAAANATLCFLVTIGILLFGRSLAKAAFNLGGSPAILAGAAAFALPRFDLFDARDWLAAGAPALPTALVLLSVVYAATITAVLLLLARAAFERKALHLSA